MKIENVVPAIALVCGLVQIILGISFFLDYETLMGLGAAGAITTNLMIVFFAVLNKNKGELFDERFRTRCVPYFVLAYFITNIGGYSYHRFNFLRRWVCQGHRRLDSGYCGILVPWVGNTFGSVCID